jgi:hypothetical protein
MVSRNIFFDADLVSRFKWDVKKGERLSLRLVFRVPFSGFRFPCSARGRSFFSLVSALLGKTGPSFLNFLPSGGTRKTEHGKLHKRIS